MKRTADATAAAPTKRRSAADVWSRFELELPLDVWTLIFEYHDIIEAHTLCRLAHASARLKPVAARAITRRTLYGGLNTINSFQPEFRERRYTTCHCALHAAQRDILTRHHEYRAEAVLAQAGVPEWGLSMFDLDKEECYGRYYDALDKLAATPPHQRVHLRLVRDIGRWRDPFTVQLRALNEYLEAGERIGDLPRNLLHHVLLLVAFHLRSPEAEPMARTLVAAGARLRRKHDFMATALLMPACTNCYICEHTEGVLTICRGELIVQNKTPTLARLYEWPPGTAFVSEAFDTSVEQAEYIERTLRALHPRNESVFA